MTLAHDMATPVGNGRAGPKDLCAGVSRRFRLIAHEPEHPHDDETDDERPPVHVADRERAGQSVRPRHQQQARVAGSVIGEAEGEREGEEKTA